MTEAERKRRLTENEIVFRNWNESIHGTELSESDQSESDFLCECCDAECAENIRMPYSEYGKIHKQTDLFTIVPGHQVTSIERVLETREDYSIVQKELIPSGKR
jgi:hypothetical protein